jgi:anti-sigma-K factor RskA
MENHIIDLLPGFALGILDEQETESVLEHLVVCDSCRLELSSYQEVTHCLGLASPLVEPPASLKDKVLMNIPPISEAFPKIPTRQAVVDRGGFVTRYLFSWRGLVAFFILALIFSNALLLRQNIQQKAAQTNFTLVKMVGTGTDTGASGVLLVSQDGKDGTLVVSGLKPLDSAHEYQLWLINLDQRTSGGVFKVSEDGYGSLWVYSEKPLNSFSQFGVTIEPMNGSPGPTGNKVLGGKL